jgi:S1-C subfamily serine protease
MVKWPVASAFLLLAVVCFAASCGQPPQSTATERAASFTSHANRRIEGVLAREFLEARYGFLIVGASDVTITRGQAGAGDVYAVRPGARGGSVASAVAIDPRGYFLTAAHVLDPAKGDILLMHYDGTAMQVERARTVWRGDFQGGGPDLGIIQIERRLKTVAHWAPAVRAGEVVLGIGPVGGPLPRKAAPLTRERGYYAGEILAKEAPAGTPPWQRIEHSCPSRPGDSGAPLFNLRGELIGIQSSGVSTARWIGPFKVFDAPRKYLVRPLDPGAITALIEQDALAKK